jgi:cysteine desulfurase/selenocysteine lyase
MAGLDDFRKDFPILNSDYVYFDNAATTQRPIQVMEAITDFYTRSNANPLRGLYDWSIDATERYENSRHTVAQFIGASRDEEIIFTRNTTESINLVAYSYGLENVHEDDEIVISVMEHHSNILPWQMVANKNHAKLVYMEPLEDGTITPEEYKSKITDRTKIVAIGHVSNVMGVTNPVKDIAEYAHSKGAVVVVDGAQSTPHIKVDVQNLDADFFAFSGHKLLAPMGIGGLYVKKEILDNMQPFLRGGEMIEYVTRQDATFAELPHKFEAGTVNAADAVGLDAAIKYLQNVGFDAIEAHEKKLTTLLMEGMKELPYIKIYGSEDPEKHCGIVTFTMDGVHPHDISSVLNEDHVCIRAGHHCAQPLMQFIGAGSTARASLYFYNTEEEVGVFLEKLKGIRKVMGYGA